jgi:hypothetical protein
MYTTKVPIAPIQILLGPHDLKQTAIYLLFERTGAASSENPSLSTSPPGHRQPAVSSVNSQTVLLTLALMGQRPQVGRAQLDWFCSPLLDQQTSGLRPEGSRGRLSL